MGKRTAPKRQEIIARETKERDIAIAKETRERDLVIQERQAKADAIHKAHELNVSRANLIHSFMPQLQSNDNRARETALLVIAALDDPELALKLAEIFHQQGGEEVLEQLSHSTNKTVAQAAEGSLERLQPQDIRDLAAEVLATIAKPYGEDITDHVFLAIEHDPNFRPRYDELRAKFGAGSINSGIGRSVKALTGLKDLGPPRGVPKSSLIQSYARLG